MCDHSEGLPYKFVGDCNDRHLTRLAFTIIGMDDTPSPLFPPEVLEQIRRGKLFSGAPPNTPPYDSDFGGTTEGRIAIQTFEEAGKPFYYSTKRDGQDVPLHHGIRLQGAMEANDIESHRHCAPCCPMVKSSDLIMRLLKRNLC